MAINVEAMTASFAEFSDQMKLTVALEAATLVDEVHTLLGSVLHEEIDPEEFTLRVGIAYLAAGVL